MNWTITDEFRTDLKQLIQFLTNKSDIQWMYDFIDNYEFEDDEYDYELEYGDVVSEEELITFRKLEILSEILQPEFMLQLDWKEGIEELKLGIEELLQNNFGISHVTLPNLRNYADSASISSDHVFSDFQRELNKQGFTLTNIISGDDDYWVMVFPSEHYNQVAALIKRLGAEFE